MPFKQLLSSCRCITLSRAVHDKGAALSNIAKENIHWNEGRILRLVILQNYILLSFVLFSYSFQMTSEFADTTEALVGYLTNGGYPPSFTPNQKRCLRRAAKQYVVMEQKLHYETKDSKKMLEVIAEEGERRRILAIAHSSGTKYCEEIPLIS